MITPHADWLVEPFRRADWVDVSRGVLAFGTPRTLIAKLCNWPDAGFHKRLVRLDHHDRHHTRSPGCFQHPVSRDTVEQWRQWYGAEPL